MALWCYNRFLWVKTKILFFCIMHPVLLFILLSGFFLLPGFKPLLLFGTFLTASALVSPSPHLLLQLMSLACELSLTSASKVKLTLGSPSILNCQAPSHTSLPVVPTCFMCAYMDVSCSPFLRTRTRAVLLSTVETWKKPVACLMILIPLQMLVIFF